MENWDIREDVKEIKGQARPSLQVQFQLSRFFQGIAYVCKAFGNHHTHFLLWFCIEEEW